MLPKLSTDAVVLFTHEDGLRGVGIITREKGVHAGELSLPGVLVREREKVVDAAKRAAEKIPGLKSEDLVPVMSLPLMEDPERDARGDTRSIPVLFATRSTDVPEENIHNFEDALALRLAFDHHDILQGLRWRVSDDAYTLRLLPLLTGIVDSDERTFSTRFARDVIEEISAMTLDPGNFNRNLRRAFVSQEIRSKGGTVWGVA